MRFSAILAIALLTGSLEGFAQGFVNLNFDDSVVTPTYNPGGITYSATVPGWFAYPIPYNTVALDAPAATLHSIIEGQELVYYGLDQDFPNGIGLPYYILLQGGTVSGGHAIGTNGASISQTGQIPPGSQRLTYEGNPNQGPFQASFNGNILFFSKLLNESSASITVWGANISAYAGQTGELRFTTPWLTTGWIDNIEFSSTVIPEPSVSALSALGGLLLAWRMRSSSRRQNKVSNK